MEPTFLVIRTTDSENLEEALAIAKEAGFDIKNIIYVKNVNNRCYLGSGTLEKVRQQINSNGIKKLCIYDELKPRHVTCLMKELNVDIVDKVMLILTVFHNHAGSKEALLQIEIAKLKHQLPLLRDYIRRVKIGELPGFLSLGRYAVDVYYKHITRRIAKLSKELEKIRKKRSLERDMRRKQGFIHIAIVGYTNAGKTTLFNTLTNLVKPTGTEMFTTLIPKSYIVNICGNSVTLVDTIGFIKNIPIGIIEAFKVVLEEISNADALLVVIDGSKNMDQLKIELYTIFNVLKDMGCVDKPIVVALNKIDISNNSIDDRLKLIKKVAEEYRAQLTDIVPISALKRINIDILKEALCHTVKLIQKNLA